MNKLIFNKLVNLAEASSIALYVDLFNEGNAQAEVVLYETPPHAESREIAREWVGSVLELADLLGKWEAELKQRGVVS